jgi:hypothetical protein
MTQETPKKTRQEDTSRTPLSDNDRIDLIANLLLDFLDEEQIQMKEEGICKTPQTKML